MRAARAAAAPARPGGAALLLLSVLGCTSSSDSKEPPKPTPPDNSVGIVIKAVSGSPELQMKATFDPGVEPGSHIAPLATIVASARASCFSANTGLAGVATADIDVQSKRVHVTGHNSWGDCFAKAIEGHPIDDPASYKVALQLSLGSRA